MQILNLKLITPPVAEPVTLAQVKQHCRVTIDDDDALLETYISAARELCERETHRSFFNQTWRLSLDHFPMYPFWSGTQQSTTLHDGWSYSSWWKYFQIKLPRPSFVSVTSITYVDMLGDTQTVDPSIYYVDTAGEPGSVSPIYGSYWPYTDLYVPDSVAVNYVAGSYGDGVNEAYCPAKVQVAIMMAAAGMYENREPSSGLKHYELPLGITRLLESECCTVLGYENN